MGIAKCRLCKLLLGVLRFLQMILMRFKIRRLVVGQGINVSAVNIKHIRCLIVLCRRKRFAQMAVWQGNAHRKVLIVVFIIPFRYVLIYYWVYNIGIVGFE